MFAKRSLIYGFGMVAVPLLLLALLITSLASAATGASCLVPSTPYDTVQSAVDDESCTLIEIGAGTYFERLTITRTLTLQGAGPLTTTIDGGGAGSTVLIAADPYSVTVTLRSLAISNGSATNGGGIHALDATLVVSDVRIVDNFALGAGGGLYSSGGDVTLTNSSVSGNHGDSGGGVFVCCGSLFVSGGEIRANEGDFHGGGLFNDGAEVLLERVTIDGNQTYVDGGGILNYGTMTIYDSGINNNTSTNYSGAGIRNNATLYVNNSTVSNNSAPIDGAGISNDFGTLRLNNVTIAGNSGSPALEDAGGDVRVRNSLISGNAVRDCDGTIRSDGYTLIGDATGCDYQPGIGDLLNQPANLGALEGTPGYRPLLLGPGINGGDPAGCRDHLEQLLALDQRGAGRVGVCDVGAYEFQGEIHAQLLPICAHSDCALFSDDFSSPFSGWPTFEDSFVKYGYLNGEYQLLSKNDSYFYLVRAPVCPHSNYTVAVDARWVGMPGHSYGLAFGVAAEFSSYYYWQVNTDYLEYMLWRRSPSGWTLLAGPTATGAINSGTATNRLQVVRDGTRIELWINGALVNTLFDGAISGPTGVALALAPYSGYPSADVRFDNYDNLPIYGLQAATKTPPAVSLEVSDRPPAVERPPAFWALPAP